MTRGTRGVSPVIGLILLIGVVAMASIGMLVVAGDSMTALESNSEYEQTQAEMKSLAQEVDTHGFVADEGSIDIPDGATVSEGAEFRVIVNDTVEYSENIGQIEKDGLVYEGGMLIDDSYVRSAPNIHTGEETAMFTVPEISGDSYDGELSAGSVDRIPIPHGTNVTIEIESEYYDHWYDELEAEGFAVEKHDDEQLVRVEFGEVVQVEEVIPAENDGVMTNSMSFTGDGIDLRDFDQIYADSYDSSNGSYDPDNPNENALIQSSSDIDFPSGGGNDATAIIKGDVETTGDVSPSAHEGEGEGNFMKVTGEVRDGDEVNESDISEATPTEDIIEQKLEKIDFDNADDLPDNEIHGETKTFDEGLYDDDSLQISGGGELVLEGDSAIQLNTLTTSGDSTIRIDGDATVILKTPSQLDETNIEVDGSLDLILKDSVHWIDTNLVNTGEKHNARDIWVYSAGELNPQTKYPNSDINLTGVFHATETTVDFGTPEDNGVDEPKFHIYGAVISEGLSVSNASDARFQIHYDESLAGMNEDGTEFDPIEQSNESKWVDQVVRDVTYLDVKVQSLSTE